MTVHFAFLFIPVVLGAILALCISYFFNRIIGTKKGLKIQYNMNPLKCNDDNDVKLNLLLSKVEEGLMYTTCDDFVLKFFSTSTDNESEDICTAEVWVGGKYFAYGILMKYGVDLDRVPPFKPNYENFTRLLALEHNKESPDANNEVQLQ